MGVWPQSGRTAASRRRTTVPPTAPFNPREEGITWARGWRSKDVDALRACVALTDTGVQLSPSDLGSYIHGLVRKTYKRYQALPTPQKLAVTAAVTVVAEAAISALAVPLARRT